MKGGSRAVVVLGAIVAALSLVACAENGGAETAEQIRETLNRVNARSGLGEPAPATSALPTTAVTPVPDTDEPDESGSDTSKPIAAGGGTSETPDSSGPSYPGGNDVAPVPLCRKADPPCLNRHGLLIEP